MHCTHKEYMYYGYVSNGLKFHLENGSLHTSVHLIDVLQYNIYWWSLHYFISSYHNHISLKFNFKNNTQYLIYFETMALDIFVTLSIQFMIAQI